MDVVLRLIIKTTITSMARKKYITQYNRDPTISITIAEKTIKIDQYAIQRKENYIYEGTCLHSSFELMQTFLVSATRKIIVNFGAGNF